jgi:hypothetical protein
MHALHATVARVVPDAVDVESDRVRLATAQMDALRLRLLELAADVSSSVRRGLGAARFSTVRADAEIHGCGVAGTPGHLEVHPGHAGPRAMKPSAGQPFTPMLTEPPTSYMEQ